EAARELEIEMTPLDDVLQNSDFITVHTPLTDETRGIINAAAMNKMKPGVRLINCARGGLIDEAALIEAIRSGKVAGAALDVFDQEPTPPGNPLLSLDEIIQPPTPGRPRPEAQLGGAR